MSAIGYLFIKSAKNKIKETLKKPVILILYVLLAAFLVWMLLSTAGKSAVEGQRNLDVYAGILIGIFLMITLMSLNQGLKQGMAIFSLADVNLLFTAPVASRRILIYGVCRQAGVLVLASFFLLFQFPNMRINLGLTGTAMWGLVLGYVGVGAAGQLLSANLYAFCAGTPGRRRLVERLIKAVLMLVLALIVYMLVQKRDFLGALRLSMGADWWNYVPVVGWGRGCAMAFAVGNWLQGVIYFLLLTAFCVGCVAFMQRAGADYYEDVLGSAEAAHRTKAAAKEGRIDRSEQVVSSKVKRAKGAMKGQGASALAYRIIREQSRKGRLYFLDLQTLGAVGTPLMCLLFMGAVPFDETGIWPALFMAAYLLVFLNLGSSLNRELTVPYVYLIPASAYQKLLAVLAPSFMKALVDGAVFGIAVTVFLPIGGIEAFFGFLVYASVSILYAAGLIIVERLLRGSKNKVLVMLVYFLGLLLLVAPGAALALVIGGGNIAGAVYLVWVGWNLLAAFVGVFLCRRLLEQPEL